MMLPFVAFCLVALVAGVRSECVDKINNCHLLDEVYCYAPYEALAKEVCAKRCGQCEDNASVNKRSHNHGPDWAEHCWDHNPDHITDPFCALLTTTTTPKPTTTPMPTTPEPTTTTTEATTTTTQATTTTTKPTTTMPPTTTERTCYYAEYNETDITSTDFGTDILLIQNTNFTLNESVHLIGDVDFCQGVCAQSLLNDGFECWAFTYNEIDRCHLYYYNRPLIIDELLEANDTTLYVKRCSDDPITTPRPTTMEPETMEPMVTTMMTTTMGTPPPPTTMAATTEAPTTQAPTTQAPTTEAPTTQAPTTQAPTTSAPTDPPTQPPTEPPTKPDTAPPTKPDTPPPTKATTTENNNSGTDMPTTMAPATTMETTTVKNTGPDTSRAPGGFEIVSANTYKIKGVPSPIPDTCFFLNQTFVKGEHWKNTCRYDCTCLDTTSNTALCTDECPHYTELPAGCAIVKENGQCCPQLKCDNDTIVNTTEGSGNVSDCVNTIDTCDYYEDQSCVGLFEPWARAHCPVRCGYCGHESCLDRISFCNLYDLDDACLNYRGWARHNCKQTCDMCLP